MKYVITGTSSGLGYCLAEKLLAKGDVVGVSRTYGKAEALLNFPNYTHILHDFADGYMGETFDALLVQLTNAICQDDYTLVLNAACFYAGSERLDPHRLEAIFSINVFSIMNLVRRLNKFSLRRIFIVNSISGLIGQGSQHEYCATKHAIMGFARSLIKSAKGSTYDVMCINPGGMKTELWSDYNDVDSSSFIDPSLVADLCVFLVTTPQRLFIESMILLPAADI